MHRQQIWDRKEGPFYIKVVILMQRCSFETLGLGLENEVSILVVKKS